MSGGLEEMALEALLEKQGDDDSLEEFIPTASDDIDMKVDMVYSPSHYTKGDIECIDAIESAVAGLKGIEAVCVSNIIKYTWRYKSKSGLEDLRKARWYLNRLISLYE